MSHGRWVSLPSAIIFAVICAHARGEVPATQPVVPESFIRFVDDHHGGGSLQTADVAFRNHDGVVVHLIAAVHIGEKSYYEALNKDFKGYDAVLYELVKPKDMIVPPAPGTPPPPGQPANPIGEFQRFLKNALELDFQLDDVDYTARNFVHADLDKETFEKMQEERGETFEQMMLKQILNSFTNPPPASAESDEDSLQDMVKILTRPDMERQIKVVIARQLGQMDATAMGLDGPDGSVIITERNKAAFKVLADTMAKGKKKLAIFYGGAHMPDMSKRLEALGFAPVSVGWNQAWDLTIRADQPSAVEKLIDGIFNSVDDKSGDDKNNDDKNN